MTPETYEKKAVKDYLDLLGYFHFPLVAGFASFKGAPDRIAIKNGKVYAIEVKGPKGKLTASEQEFAGRWTLNGGTYLSGTSGNIIDQLKN
jgi:hypothetical protein